MLFLINFDNANYSVYEWISIFFYLNEHEPIHIHVSRGDSEARIVLLPAIDVSYCKGFKKNELRSIIEIIMKRSLKSGTKPLISKGLGELLAGSNDEEITIKYDEFDRIIRDNHLRIQRFVLFRDLDLVIFVLNNRRIIQRPLSLYPILEHAVEHELNQFQVSDYGIHWPEIDADLSLRAYY